MSTDSVFSNGGNIQVGSARELLRVAEELSQRCKELEADNLELKTQVLTLRADLDEAKKQLKHDEELMSQYS